MLRSLLLVCFCLFGSCDIFFQGTRRIRRHNIFKTWFFTMQKPWCLEMEWDMINIYTVVDFTGGVFPEAYEAQKTVYEYFDSKDEANDRIYALKLRTNLPYYTRTFKLSHQNQWEEVNNPFFFNESTSSWDVAH